MPLLLLLLLLVLLLLLLLLLVLLLLLLLLVLLLLLHQCSYVTLRLLGESADNKAVTDARNWVSGLGSKGSAAGSHSI